MTGRLQWDVDGRQWPHRDASAFVDSGHIRWHVQRMGSGPALLLLHGTGASCHSWRGLLPLLAERFTVIAPDLPGHAFTQSQGGAGAVMTLPGMAHALWRMLDGLDVQPAMIVGHSAGAAIAIQMLMEREAPIPVAGFNPALIPFPGPGALLFPAMAKLLFLNPIVPRLFAGLSRLQGGAGRFIYRSTRSHIDAEGLRCYEKLLGSSAHCRGALAMMSTWDLEAFERRLPKVKSAVLLVHSERDNAVPLSAVRRASERLAQARMDVLPGLGHLAHEEDPAGAAARVQAFYDEHAAPLST